ncbi:DUF3313 family protein [Pseudomonadota bacterium]
MSRYFVSTLILIGMIAVPAAIMAESEPPEISLEGLELVEKTRRGNLYADPDIDWSIYEQIQLEAATVSFRKNWQRDQNRYQSQKVRASDMERIKSSLAELFDRVFSEQLVKGGYQITEASEENVMKIVPRIVDLDVYAPDTRSPGIQRSYADSAGRMTLKLEMYDSVTGDLIASASDRREAPRRGYMQWTNSVTNNAEARRMLERWAVRLVELLDEARNTKATQ